MFNKLSLLALVAPLVSGLTINVPKNPTSGGPVTLSWNWKAGDPNTFSIELTNEVFHNSYAIANSVIPEQGSIDIILPIVPIGDGYTLQAVEVGNINNIFAETVDFAVADNTGATSTSSGTTSSSSSISKSQSHSGSSTLTKTSSASASSTPVASTNSGFGTTVTTPTSSLASATNATSGNAAPAVTSSSAAAGSPLKMGGNMGVFAAVILSAVAGAAAVL